MKAEVDRLAGNKRSAGSCELLGPGRRDLGWDLFQHRLVPLALKSDQQDATVSLWMIERVILLRVEHGPFARKLLLKYRSEC